jgi:phenylacetate-CoA ligase
MTDTTMTDSAMTDSAAITPYEQLRQRHLARFGSLLPLMVDRLTWPAARLAEHRTAELRRLVRVARETSPWHRERLADVDVDALDGADLTGVPVMTKDDLMAHFDDVVTDDRLRLGVVEDHLASLTSDAYLFDRYHAVASAGSSGNRGVFVYDWDAWAITHATFQRHSIRGARSRPAAEQLASKVVVVAASAPTHISSALPQTFSTGGAVIDRIPVDRPTEEIVAGLNAARPEVLVGYPSVLHVLAAEAGAGRLRISPQLVSAVAEPLLPEIRTALAAAFGAPVVNGYGSSEGGGIAVGCGAGPWLHLSDDLVIVEPVDAAGRPVPPGRRADKVYLTNLVNHALPLIRYELTDQIELLDDPAPCPCGSTHRRIADPYGRLDDLFTYGAVAVHPHLFRSPLSRRPEIVEYRVRQTPAGATVAVRATGPFDAAALAVEITAGLAGVGVPRPRVDVEVTERLPRPVSGKLSRFEPLAVPDRSRTGAHDGR